MRWVWSSQNPPSRNCPKRVQPTFRARTWLVYTGPKVPESAVSVVRKATLQAPPKLFRQFL
jgi:hypothetical protein